MAFHNLYWLAVAVAIILPMNLAFTLLLAVVGHHVLPGWPYISDAGNTGKARGVFSILCNIGAYFMIACAYFKYRHIKLWLEIESCCDQVPSVNVAALVFGILLGFGLHTAANFQTEEVPLMHRIGAFTGFLSGVVYFALLSWIGYKLPHSTRPRTLKQRTVLAVIAGIFFFTTIIPGRIAAYQNKDFMFKVQWRQGDPGFYMHLLSTVSEWILALMIAYMFMTLIPDFQQMGIGGMKMYVKSRT